MDLPAGPAELAVAEGVTSHRRGCVTLWSRSEELGAHTAHFHVLVVRLRKQQVAFKVDF
jgi:hypothetical protein